MIGWPYGLYRQSLGRLHTVPQLRVTQAAATYDRVDRSRHCAYTYRELRRRAPDRLALLTYECTPMSDPRVIRDAQIGDLVAHRDTLSAGDRWTPCDGSLFAARNGKPELAATVLKWFQLPPEPSLYPTGHPQVEVFSRAPARAAGRAERRLLLLPLTVLRYWNMRRWGGFTYHGVTYRPWRFVEEGTMAVDAATWLPVDYVGETYPQIEGGRGIVQASTRIEFHYSNVGSIHLPPAFCRTGRGGRRLLPPWSTPARRQ